MSALGRESRPAGNEAAIANSISVAAAPIIPEGGEARNVAPPTLTAAEVYAVIRGRLAACVITKDQAGSVRVRPYVNLRAADRAVRRAVERGQAATVVMVRQDVAPLIGDAQ